MTKGPPPSFTGEGDRRHGGGGGDPSTGAGFRPLHHFVVPLPRFAVEDWR